MTRRRLIAAVALLLLSVYPCLFLANASHLLLSGISVLPYHPSALLTGVTEVPNIRQFLICYVLIVLLLLAWIVAGSSVMNYRSGLKEIFPGVKTPLPSGENQFGSSRWLKKSEYKKAFDVIPMKLSSNGMKWVSNMGRYDLEQIRRLLATGEIMEKEKNFPYAPFQCGGLVVGQSKDGRKLYISGEDTHSMTIGATRSAKSRGIVLPSICVTALAGESMVLADSKGELFFYTAPLLRRLGFEVITIDFENPRKSNKSNFMQLINDCLEFGDISEAKSAVNDLVEGLVGKADSKTGERIWTEGEKSIMACCIMAVAYDNRNKPHLQNLTNVYHFIARMCAPQEGQKVLPLQQYLNEQPDSHPAKSLAGISNVAHVRTRSSFYASALATLRIFEDYNIADMTSSTDYDMYATGNEKRAIFIILPDERDTYYGVASLYIYQHYQMLVKEAKKNGGRLKRRVEFFLDEVGNFTFIPNFSKLITVGAGRGCRFHLFLQGSKQLDEVYGENISSIVRANCETWVYLQSDEPEILDEIKTRLGTYTIKSPSVSANTQGGGGSASYNYTGRDLLTVDEIKQIKRPYQLVMTRFRPVIMYEPDISRMIFNKMLGLGDKQHNIEVIKLRNAARPERTIQTPQLWGIWKKYEEAVPPPPSLAPVPAGRPTRSIGDEMRF